MALFWNDNFLNKIRNNWLRRVAKIQYYAGGVWYDAMITSKAIEGNTLKVVCQTQDSATLTITAVRIVDSETARRVLLPSGNFLCTSWSNRKEVKIYV